MSPRTILTLATAFLVGCTASVIEEAPEEAESSSIASNASSVETVIEDEAEAETEKELPRSARLDLPFASQAPLGNWDMPYQEACEEASLLLVHHFLEGTSVKPEQMDQEILDIVAWEESRGLPPDIDTSELATVARERYGYQTETFFGNDVTIERIERAIAEGNPVIVPLAGREVGNPYYSGEGPWYHVLVIVGYDGNEFITHDVGTRRGEYYEYGKEHLLSAIHDWTGVKENIAQGQKAMLIVRK